MATLKRYKFCLNTSSLCFLCSQSVEVTNDDGNNSNVYSYSLQNIIQYLNIDLCKIKTLSTKPVSLLNKTDIRVSLCFSCGVVHKEISKLYNSMEVIRMKLDYNFELFQKRMESSIESKLQSSEREHIRHSELVKELRLEIHKKCELRMPNYLPRVALEKTNDFILKNTTNLVHHENMLTVARQEISSPNSCQLAFVTPQEASPDSSDWDNSYVFTTSHQFTKQEPEEDDCKNIGSVLEDAEDSVDTVSNFDSEDISSASKTASGKQTFQATESEGRKKQSFDSTRILKSKKSLHKYCKKDPVTGAFHCLGCVKKFTDRSTVRLHFNAIHLNKRFKCSLCSKVFKYARDLRRHKKTCLQNLEQRLEFKFVCIFCEKRFETKKKLNDHRTAVHLKVQRYPCDLCDKRFTRLSYLKTHRAGAHLGQRFSCRFCGKESRYVSNHRQHEKTCKDKNKIKVEVISNPIA